MNYLFHLYLSGNEPAILTGNFMGDFVKGPLAGRFPERLRQGLALHRRIDSFAQAHPAFTASRLRIAPEFGLYRGILVDLYYDHFLASAWQQWHEEPLPVYLARIRKIVEDNHDLLPQPLQRLVPIIFDDMIPSYLTTDGIAGALGRMSRRVARANPLAGGGRELTRNYPALQEDFLQFLPDVHRFAQEFLQG